MVRLRRIDLPIDFRAFQLIYAARILWWGIGSLADMNFSLNYLSYLKTIEFGVGMIIIGMVGCLAAFRKYFLLSYLFHIFGVFLFGVICYSFFFKDPTSVAGVNYFLEMMGFVWLTIRIKRFALIYPVDGKLKSEILDLG